MIDPDWKFKRGAHTTPGDKAVRIGRGVKLVVEDDRLIVRPTQPARQGWEAAFSQMGEEVLIVLQEIFAP